MGPPLQHAQRIAHLYERALLANMTQCPGQFIGLSPYSCFSTSKLNMLSL
jgi:hypothetical protein